MNDQEDETLHAATHDATPSPPSAELERLFREHHGKVFAAAYRITGRAQDAEDVLQTVFLRLLGRGDALDLSPNPGSYLYRAAVNAALDLMRSRARKRDIPIDDFVELPAARGDDPERIRLDGEIRRCLRRALLALGPKSAEVFALRFLEGMGNRDIAKMLQSSQTAVGVMVHRARNRIKNEIAPCVGGLHHA